MDKEEQWDGMDELEKLLKDLSVSFEVLILIGKPGIPWKPMSECPKPEDRADGWEIFTWKNVPVGTTGRNWDGSSTGAFFEQESSQSGCCSSDPGVCESSEGLYAGG